MSTENIGKLIKTYRLSRGMTQKQLAEKIGVGVSTITMYERGQRIPNDDIKEALADVFNVSIAELYGNDTGNIRLSPGENRLLANYRGMTDKAQDLLLVISDRLAEIASKPLPVEQLAVPAPANDNIADEWIDDEFEDMNVGEAAITDIDHTSHYATESENDSFDPA